MPRTRWPADRLARAAFLCGKGYSADQIATDVMIRSTRFAVEKHLRSAGMVARDVGADDVMVPIAATTLAALKQPARQRAILPGELVGRLLTILAEDPALLANVLDDDDDQLPAQSNAIEPFRIAAE